MGEIAKKGLAGGIKEGYYLYSKYKEYLRSPASLTEGNRIYYSNSSDRQYQVVASVRVFEGEVVPIGDEWTVDITDMNIANSIVGLYRHLPGGSYSLIHSTKSIKDTSVQYWFEGVSADKQFVAYGVADEAVYKTPVYKDGYYYYKATAK